MYCASDGSAIGPPWQRTRTSELTALRRVVHGRDLLDAFVERQCRRRADRAFGRQTHVGNQNIGAGTRQLAGLLGVEHIGGRKQVQSWACADHVDFQAESHAGLFEPLAELAVDQAHGRKILHAREAGRLRRRAGSAA